MAGRSCTTTRRPPSKRAAKFSSIRRLSRWSYNFVRGEFYMRVIFLLMVFLSTLISARPGLASEKEQSGCCAAPSVSELFQKQPAVRIFTAPSRLSRDVLDFSKKSDATGDRFSSLRPAPSFMVERSPVCYVIDTYTVAKEEADSDSTMIVGHSICAPSSKFRVEHSIEPRTPASR